jgi:transposase InsO family protein
VRFAFIAEHERTWTLTDLCRVVDVSRSGFHSWRDRGLSPHQRRDEQLAVEVAAVHERSRKTYGSPRVHAELRARGVRTGRKRVARLMRAKGLVVRCKRRFRRTTDSRHSQPIAPNVVARDFRTIGPNKVWATDVTAIWTLEGWAYLAVMLDLFSRRVIGWRMSESNDTALALDVLREAVRLRRPPHGLIHHSDRGSPYASAEYRAELARHGIVASMSRTGDCWDNAVAESFFATLRAELVDHQAYASPAVAASSIGGFSNISRRHSYLGYLNPVEHELRCHTAEQTT